MLITPCDVVCDPPVIVPVSVPLVPRDPVPDSDTPFAFAVVLDPVIEPFTVSVPLAQFIAAASPVTLPLMITVLLEDTAEIV